MLNLLLTQQITYDINQVHCMTMKGWQSTVYMLHIQYTEYDQILNTFHSGIPTVLNMNLHICTVLYKVGLQLHTYREVCKMLCNRILWAPGMPLMPRADWSRRASILPLLCSIPKALGRVVSVWGLMIAPKHDLLDMLHVSCVLWEQPLLEGFCPTAFL